MSEPLVIGTGSNNIIIRYCILSFTDMSDNLKMVYGLVSEVKITFEPIMSGTDSFGREIVGGYNVTIEWDILANDNTSLHKMFEAQSNFGTGKLHITASNGNSFVIPSVKINHKFEINGSGKISSVKANCKRFFNTQELISLLNTNVSQPPEVNWIIDGGI
jgi:hypothetical protein